MGCSRWLAAGHSTCHGTSAVRSVGGLVGDASHSPLFLIEWGLTLAPEQISNVASQAPWNERIADGIVDSGNFLVGEAAGWVVGVFTIPQAGPGALGAKLAVDVAAGGYYDARAHQLHWRESLAAKIGEIPDAALRSLAERTKHMLEQEAYRIPTPEISPVPTGTPSPPASALPESAPNATPSPAPKPSPDDQSSPSASTDASLH